MIWRRVGGRRVWRISALTIGRIRILRDYMVYLKTSLVVTSLKDWRREGERKRYDHRLAPDPQTSS